MWRGGIGYCDGCAAGPATWIVGAGWTKFSPAVLDGFKAGGVNVPTTNHV